MSDHDTNTERDRALRYAKEIREQYEALSPEERAVADALTHEVGDSQFIDELLRRYQEGSVSEDELKRWMNATATEIGQRKGKN
jgi:hypothetical protein